MNDFIQFLTSKEIMAVYVISGVVCFICLVVYIYQKTSEKIRRKNNTRELNKLIEEVRERVPEVQEDNTITYEEPVLVEPIEILDEEVSVSDMLNVVSEKEEKKEEPVIIEEIPEKEEFEYTSIEPDKETAKKELDRLVKELEEQEKQESIPMTKFEEEQEANAIISVDELLKRGKELYEANEVSQLQDTGDEPISIQDLEKLMKKEEKVSSEVVPKQVEVIEKKEVKVETPKEEVRRFKSTPFISPIYGIERKHELELENTANYDKLDEQIKKSNEFVMSLKEFQKTLD